MDKNEAEKFEPESEKTTNVSEREYMTCKQDHEFSPEVDKIFTALSKAQSQMGMAVKGSKNPFYKNKYADLSSQIEVSRKPLTDNQLAVIQMPFRDKNEVGCKTILGHSSGQWLSCLITFQLQKLDPQSCGSAITYARRYGRAAICDIGQEDDDGNSHANHGKPTVEAPKPSAKPETKPNPQPDPEPAETINQDLAIKLINTAKKNGWQKSDLMGFLNTLGYHMISEINTLDYNTVFEQFNQPKKENPND